MAFAIRNLSVLAYANGFTLWHYKSAADGLARIGSQNYFEDATDMLSTGDIMMLSATDGARIVAIDTAPGGNISVGPLA